MTANNLRIGVLGLQGAFAKHITMFEQLGAHAHQIRYSREIENCDGLVLPGGESTTISKIIDEIGIRKILTNYDRPIFGTCAGAILLSENAGDPRVTVLARVPIKSNRNAWGRQVESFTTSIQLSFDKRAYKAVFIRAPKLSEPGAGVKVLASINGDIVLVEYKKILLATFHPELTDDPRIHEYFLGKVIKG